MLKPLFKALRIKISPFSTPLVALLLFSLITFAIPFVTRAAEIYMTPAVLSSNVDEVFTLRIVIRSLREKVNAVEGAIIFPPELVEVVGFEKAGSIIQAWAEEPSFSNIKGVIAFAGGIQQDGFQGSEGLVFQVIVRAKNSGTAAFTFKSSRVLTADGQATDVLTGMHGASVIIKKNEFGGETDRVEKYTIAESADNTGGWPQIFWQTTTIAVSIALLAAILVMVLLSALQKKRKAILFKETREAREVMENNLISLRQKIRNQVEAIGKITDIRELTQEEIRLRETLLGDIDTVERFIRKEINDIEDELLNRYSHENPIK